MVAETAPLPNIKKLFIPSDDYLIADCDLDRADLQVVVWEADDDDLKAKLREGVDLHKENAKDAFGLQSVSSVTDLQRHRAKGFVHGTNYGASARTIAKTLGITTREADVAQKRWFSAHPGILEWHRRTEQQLIETRQVSNKFGYCRYYFERIAGLLPQALAWVPQSTVAIVTNRGLYNLEEKLPAVEILLQVHDSLVFQFPKSEFPTILPRIKECLEIPIPYEDELTIPVGIQISDKSWGDCKEYTWDGQPVKE